MTYFEVPAELLALMASATATSDALPLTKQDQSVACFVSVC